MRTVPLQRLSLGRVKIQELQGPAEVEVPHRVQKEYRAREAKYCFRVRYFCANHAPAISCPVYPKASHLLISGSISHPVVIRSR